MGDKIAILDTGAQYGKVIDRRVRELNVESELLSIETPPGRLKKYKGIIIPGGPESVYNESAPRCDSVVFNLGIPILGICYGMQLMNQVYGGLIVAKSRREDCETDIVLDPKNSLFQGLEPEQQVLMSHGDSIERLAKGFEVIATSSGLIAAIQNERKRLYGTQFHPEVDLTINGKQILRNFLYKICRCSGDYTIEDRIQSSLKYIKEMVGKEKALILASGGVDSSVALALINRVLESAQIYVVHIDNGFMRKNESMTVYTRLRQLALKNFYLINAAKEFYNATTTRDGIETPPLNQVIDPEIKRTIIGDTFMRVARRVMQELGLNPRTAYLVQGTLRPDLIESASKLASQKASSIKTHHNDTPLVREWRKLDKVVEPNKDLHKDEVRRVGIELSLPEDIVFRQPFPGPGLAVRIICAEEPYITPDFDKIASSLAEIASGYRFNSALLPIKTVGVQGDARSYSYLAALAGKQDWKKLKQCANEIPKQIHQINRVVYIFGDVNNNTTITPTKLTPDAITQLQEADDVVNQLLSNYDLLKSLSQVPVISFPSDFGVRGNRSIGIRTFITNDFMTGMPALPGKEMPIKCLEDILKTLHTLPWLSRIAYDLTSKPPGTTEWE